MKNNKNIKKQKWKFKEKRLKALTEHDTTIVGPSLSKVWNKKII